MNQSLYQTWSGHINGLIIQQYKDELRGTVADFGCGDRRFSMVLATKCQIDAVVSIDKGIEFLRSDLMNGPVMMLRKGSMIPPIRFFQADLHQIPLDDRSIDNAISFHTLEHVQYPGQVIREMARVLRPRGKLVVSVPYKTAYMCADHHHFFDLPDLEELFETNGFSTQQLYHDRRIDDHGNKHNCITGVFVNENTMC